MSKAKQFVVPVKEGGWGVRRGGAMRLTSKHETKEEAKDVAREIAKNQKTELVVMGKDGKIQNPNSFGNDPRHIHDRKH